MLKHTLVAIAFLGAIACSKKSDDAKPADKPVADKPADKPVEQPAPVPSGPEPDDTKEMMNLELAPMGAWKPTWDADAKVAKWENDDYMTGIVIRIVKDKLDTIDDLKEAAPMMMQIGTAITKVVEEKKTAKGWYAIVESNETVSADGLGHVSRRLRDPVLLLLVPLGFAALDLAYGHGSVFSRA